MPPPSDASVFTGGQRPPLYRRMKCGTVLGSVLSCGTAWGLLATIEKRGVDGRCNWPAYFCCSDRFTDFFGGAAAAVTDRRGSNAFNSVLVIRSHELRARVPHRDAERGIRTHRSVRGAEPSRDPFLGEQRKAEANIQRVGQS
jgi:hypothetical protein